MVVLLIDQDKTKSGSSFKSAFFGKEKQPLSMKIKVCICTVNGYLSLSCTFGKLCMHRKECK